MKVWRSPLHAVFYWNVEGKTRKKAKEHREFRGVLGRWRVAAIDRTTFHACQRCRKTTVFAVFFSALGCHLARKSLSWPAMPVSNKKQEFQQRKRIKLFDDFWVRAYRLGFFILPQGAGREHGQQSIFSSSIFGILVERLASSVFIFAPILLRFYLLCSSMQGLIKYLVTDF